MAVHSYEAGEYEPHSESLSREMGLRPHTLDDATPKHAYAHRRAHTHTHAYTPEKAFSNHPVTRDPILKSCAGWATHIFNPNASQVLWEFSDCGCSLTATCGEASRMLAHVTATCGEAFRSFGFRQRLPLPQQRISSMIWSPTKVIEKSIFNLQNEQFCSK